MAAAHKPSVTSPALGIAYLLWLKAGWVVACNVVAMLILAAIVQLFPAAAPYCCAAAVPIIGASLVYLLNVFSMGPSDLGLKTSGFPQHMKVLPVSTRALVAWPMLFAALTISTLWIMPTCLVFRPGGLPMPIFLPATMLAAVCLWVQAIGWCPMPSPFVRVPMLLLAFVPLMLPMALGLTYLDKHVISIVFLVCSFIWALVAYPFGVMGLSRARCGQGEADWLAPIADWWAKISGGLIRSGRAPRPFRSAFTAQLWHECRRNAIVLPVMMAFVGGPMFLLMLLPILSPERQQAFVFGSTNLSVPGLCLLIWAGLPFLFALSNGAGMAKLDIWGKTDMPAFFATRPLTTTQFVLIKFCATALSVAAAWTITLALFTVWAIFEASSLNQHKSVIRAALDGATPRGVFAAVLVVFAIVLMTWRNVVSGMWPTLLGRKYLANAIGIAFLAQLIVVGCAGMWIYQHPDYHAIFWRILPWIVAAELVLKVVVAIWLSDVLRRRGFISRTQMNSFVAGWLLLVVGIVGLISLYTVPTWTLAAGVALMVVPFASLVAAPLALDWNRHR